MWNENYSNKQICEKLKCCDETVTKALRAYDISEEEVRSRSNYNQKKSIVAIDIETGKPLKIFSSINECCLFFDHSLKQIGGLCKCLKKHYRWQGYYWEYLTENNYPIKELTDKEFFQFQQNKIFIKNSVMRERISKSNRKVERCSREELKNLIRTTSFVQIGKKFGISDNAIRKWCVYYNLPSKVKDIKAISDKDWDTI